MGHWDKHLTVWASGVKGQEKVQESVLKGRGKHLLLLQMIDFVDKDEKGDKVWSASVDA